MNLKFTQDHIFKRIIVFQSALLMSAIMLGMVYTMRMNMVDDRFGMIVLSILSIMFGYIACLLMRDTFRKDRSKILSTLESLDGGVDLLGILILIVVYVLFGLVALILTFLYRLILDGENILRKLD